MEARGSHWEVVAIVSTGIISAQFESLSKP